MSVLHSEEGSPLLASFEDNKFQELKSEDVEVELVALVQQPPGSHQAGIIDEVVEEVHHLVDAKVEQLQDDKENNFHSIGIPITHNSATITSITSISPRSHQNESSWSVSTQHTIGKSKADESPPLSAYFLLSSAVVSLSLIGPLLVFQDNATPSMKIVWRMTGTFLILLPAACYELYTEGFRRLNYSQWCTFLLSTMCYDITTLTFVSSLDYTSVGNAVVVASSQALILLVGKVVVGDPVSSWEVLGAMVAFGGAALCSKDTVDTRQASNPFLGDLLGIISAVAAVGYLVFAKSARDHMPIYTFMVLTMGIGAFLVWMFQLTVLREQATFDMDYNHGVWGFLLPVEDRLPLEMITVVVCNDCGTLGYVQAMQHFDNFVISSAALMEPVSAEFMAVFFGVGQWPGLWGWLGNVMVASGTFVVLYNDRKGKTTSDDKSPSP